MCSILNTYDHRVWKTGLPVRSAVLKPHAGELVVGWVTTSESSLLYVFVFVLYTSILNPPSTFKQRLLGGCHVMQYIYRSLAYLSTMHIYNGLLA
ncbi:hypothetical protein VN97_g9422 [Penicillium thymicola]|uniref:Uncharacterized protein n=1 Tax=Penicillium thymicola TaxID=293382 RepID=A0AAI9TAZ2_PENTH|nr:hypothetical protein VN97_g9422 [Penicillium thymicola]